MSGGDLFDAEDLLFRMMGQEDLARLVAAGFLEDAPRQFAALVRGAEAGNMAAVSAAAHALKGASGNAGSPLVYRLSSSIEDVAREGGLALELLPELAIAIDAVKDPVLSFLAEKSP